MPGPEDVDAGAREHYADAALYDHEYRRRRADVAFYRRLARDVLGGPGRVLELGCGSGRVTLPLARDGHQVDGLDASPSMLAALAARCARAPAAVASRITALDGDLRALPRPRHRYPLVLAAFHVLEHLYTRAEFEACLAGVRRALAPGGVFAFDVQHPDLAWLSRDPTRRWSKTRFRHPTTGTHLEYATSHRYDPVAQVAHIQLHYTPVAGGRARVVRLAQRRYFPAELEALLAASGFQVLARWGDFAGGDLGPSSASQIILCGPHKRPR